MGFIHKDMDRLMTPSPRPVEKIDQGWLVLAISMLVVLAFFVGAGFGARATDNSPSSGESRIGGTPVPHLECEEDEVIGFAQVGTPPYDLECVHVETFQP